MLGWKEHTGRDTLDTATTRQTADSGLGDALDVVTKNLAMTLGTALAEALAALAACGKVVSIVCAREGDEPRRHGSNLRPVMLMDVEMDWKSVGEVRLTMCDSCVFVGCVYDG